MGHGDKAAQGDFCGAKTRAGTQCGKRAGWGTEHVGAGKCKLHGGSTPSGTKAAAMATARIMGEEMNVDPHEALLWCVRIAAGEIRYCSTQIAQLRAATEKTMFGKKLDMWIETRQVAVAQLARYSKMALDAGVAERQVQIAERYGELIATLIGGILGDLKLTPGQQKKAPRIVRQHLQSFEGAAQTA